MTAINFPGYRDCQVISSGLYSRLFTAVRNSDGATVILKAQKSYPPIRKEEEALRHEHNIMEGLKDSPSIPRLCDGEPHGDIFFIAMEKIDSPSLAALLSVKNKFQLEEFLTFAIAAVTALENIHRFDVIHKDISDKNILYDEKTRECKLIDFNLSVTINHQKVIPVNPEFLEGTLAYISPEQSGRMNRGIDYRTDYYSLGVVFYYVLTGKYPFFSSDPAELVNMLLTRSPAPPHKLDPAIPEVVSSIIMKLLAKEPEGRYQSIAGIRGDLTDCLKSLKEGKIASFPLACHDTHEKFQIPGKIYGREKELRRLLMKYEAVMKGGTGLVLVAGYSGIGKSSLVHEMYKPIEDKQGEIVTGKFDQFKHNIPYFAFSQAFKEFIERMLMEPEEKLILFKDRVLEALGSNGQIVIDTVPSLEKVIGKQPPVPNVGLEETQNRFAYIFQRFIQCLPTADRPLVLFLDDLQWADNPSFRLLESLLQIECPHLLIVGGYRDNEVDEGHPLSLMLESLEKQKIAYEKLLIVPLEFSDVQKLIADTLYESREDVTSLAEICLTKTAGNPFFLIQLLDTLYTSDLVSYDWNTARWVWDLEKIRNAPLSDNIVELMIDKIRMLDPELQSLLMTAACIGNRFTLDILEAVRGQSRRRLRPLIENLLRKEFLISQEKHYYSAQTFEFAHARIEEAAHELVDEVKRINLHIAVAEHLLKMTPPEDLKEMIFTIVDHYNRAIAGKNLPLTVEGQRKQIALLNFNAAKIAKEAAAYEIALKYCQYTLKWLGEEDWDKEYDFLIGLYSKSIECAYLSEKFDLMEEYGDVIFSHSRDILDECRAIKAKGLYFISKGNPTEAGTMLLKAFKRLGVSLPNNPWSVQVLLGLARVFFAQLMTKRSIEKLADLPPMDDVKGLAYLSLCNDIGPALYVSGRKKTFAFTVFKGVRIIFRQGNSKEGAILFAAFGMILSSLGLVESGYRYGKLALTLADRYNDPKGLTSVRFVALAITSMWKESIYTIIPLIKKNYISALEAGNLQFGAYSLRTECTFSFYAGIPLKEVLDKIDSYKKTIIHLKDKSTIAIIANLRQTLLHLIGPKEPSFAEEESIPQVDATGWGLFYLDQLFLSWIYRDFARAQDMIKAFSAHEKGINGLYDQHIFYFYKTLTLTALFETLPLTKRLGMKRTIKRGLARFKKCAKHCPSNHLHKHLLLRAEWARIEGKTDQAERLYEQAIESAAKENFLSEEAVAYELAARFYLGINRAFHASLFLQQALRCYEKWGALNKVKHLSKEFHELLQQDFTFL